MERVRAKSFEVVCIGNLNKRIALINMQKIIEDSSYSSVIDTG